MWFKATCDVHSNSSISQLFVSLPAGTEIKRFVEIFPSSFMLYVICLAGCVECGVVAASAGARGRSLWACVSLSLSLSLCLSGWLRTWRWSPRGRLSGPSASRSSQGLCLCAALELAGSAPTERGEMCLTYAQRTLSGRLKQQDTINDHRIRLLQYGFPHPHLLHRGAVIFHGLAGLCVCL